MESEDRSSTASTISGIYRNILFSPAPICMFYFSHPFGISTPKNSSNDNNNNNNNGTNKNYSTSTRNHRNRQNDFYDHNHLSTKQSNTNDREENIMDNHTAAYVPWPRNTWLRKEYDLPPLVQLLARQNDNNVPGLEEILQTIRQAWNTPKGERSLNHSQAYSNINKIQLSSSQTSIDCIDKTYTMGSGTANMNPGPGLLLRRRYSVPEIIMRKHSLAQQKAYEESVAATTAASTPYPLSPKMTAQKVESSSVVSSSSSSSSSNQDQNNDQMTIKRNRPIFSSTASDSNLSSSRRSGGCGYNNGIGYGPGGGHGEESMRRQLLRRIWSKEFKRLESRSGSWSPPMRRSQRRLPPVEPMDKCEQCLKLDEHINTSQQNGINNIINNSAISKRLRLHSSPTYSIIDNKSCRNTKCNNNPNENTNYEDVLNNNLQTSATTTTTTTDQDDKSRNNEISASTHEIVESEDSSQFSDSSDFIDNKIRYNNDSNNNNMITYITDLNPMSPPKSPFPDDNNNNNNNSNSNASHDNNNNNNSEIIKNDNRILTKNYSNENRQTQPQQAPPTTPSSPPPPSSSSSSSAASPSSLPLPTAENTNANDKSICSRLDDNEHITHNELSCKENSNENSLTNTIVKQVITTGNVINDEEEDDSGRQKTDQYISNLLINNLNNSNIKNYSSSSNMNKMDELNERLNTMQQHNNNADINNNNNNNKNNKSIISLQMDLNKNENDINNNNIINVDVDDVKKSQSFIVSSVYLSPQRLQKISNNKTTTLILSTTTITTTAATTSLTTTATTASQEHLIEDVINNNNNNNNNNNDDSINNNLNNVLKSTEEIYFPQYSMESKADQSNYSTQCSTNDDQDDESPTNIGENVINNNVIHVNTGSTYPTENLVQPIFVTRLATFPRTESMEVQPPSASNTDDIEIDNASEMIAKNKTINEEFKPIKHSNEGPESEDEDDDSLVDSLDDPMSMQSMYPSNKNNNASVDESIVDKKSQFEIKSQTFFVPMGIGEEINSNKTNQYRSSSIAAQMPDKIREKLDKRQQNLDLKKHNEQIRKQKKIQQIMKRGMMMNNNAIERKAIKPKPLPPPPQPPPPHSNSLEKIDTQDKAIAMVTDNTTVAAAVSVPIVPTKKSIKNNVTLFSSTAGGVNRQNRNKILRSEIGMLETYTIDARGNMKFKAIQQTVANKPKQPSNSVIIVEPIINQKQRSSKVNPRSDHSTNNQRNGKNDVLTVKRSYQKSTIDATNNDNHQKNDQDIITPGDVECGPRRMYQKTEIHDGEKRIEILEIVECIDSAAATGTDDGDTREQSTVDDVNVISSPDDSMSSGASSSSSSSTSTTSSSTVQIGGNKLSIINNRKSKIPIPVFKPIINNVISTSNTGNGSNNSSTKFTTIAKTTTTTTTTTNVVDQMIADLLIEALNHPNELNIEFINKTTTSTTTKRDLIKNSTNKRSIKSRRNLSKSINTHKPINGHGSLLTVAAQSQSIASNNNRRSANGTKYQQIFDVIPEEKSSLSIDSSSNEDAIVASTTTVDSSSSICPVSSIMITKGKQLSIKSPPAMNSTTTTTTVSTAPETSTDENNNDNTNNSDKNNNSNNDHNGNNIKEKQLKNSQQMSVTSEFKRQASVPSSRGKAAIENDSTEWLGFFKRHESGSSMDSANEDEPESNLIPDTDILNNNIDNDDDRTNNNNNNPSLNTKSYLIPLTRPSFELPDQTMDDLSNSLTTPTTISSNDMMIVSSSGSENILSIIEKTFGDDPEQQEPPIQDSSSQTFLGQMDAHQNVKEEVKTDEDKSNEECSINFLKECINKDTCNSCGIQKNINLKEKLTLDDNDEEANTKSNFKLNNHKSKIIKHNNNNNNNENIWNQVKNSIDDNGSNLEIIGLAATINRPTMMYIDDGGVLPTRHDIIDRQSFIVIKDPHPFEEINNDLKKTWKSPPMIIDDESSNRIRERCSDCCYCNPNLHKNKSANTRKNCNYCKGQLMQKQQTIHIEVDDGDDLEDIKNNNKKGFPNSTKSGYDDNNNNNQKERINTNQNDKYYESMTKSDHVHTRTKSRDSDTVSLKCTKINQHIRRRFIHDEDEMDKDDYYKNDNLRFTDRNSRNVINRKNRENVDVTNNVRDQSEDNQKQSNKNINRSQSRDKFNNRYIRLPSPNGHRKTTMNKDNYHHQLSQSFDESSSAESSSCSSVSESSTIISPLDHRKKTVPLSETSTNPWESSTRFQHTNNKAFFETSTAAVTTTTTTTAATVESNALSATITTIPTVAITPATSSQPSQRSSRYEQFYENINNNNNSIKKKNNNNLITKSVGGTTNKNIVPKEINSGWSLTLAGTYHDDMAPDVEMRLSFPTTTTAAAAAKTITKTNINRPHNPKINGNHLCGIGATMDDNDDYDDDDNNDDEDNINNNNKNDIKTIRNLQKIKNVSNGNMKSYHLDNCQRGNQSMLAVDHEQLQYDNDQTIDNESVLHQHCNCHNANQSYSHHQKHLRTQQQQQQQSRCGLPSTSTFNYNPKRTLSRTLPDRQLMTRRYNFPEVNTTTNRELARQTAKKAIKRSEYSVAVASATRTISNYTQGKRAMSFQALNTNAYRFDHNQQHHQHQYQYLGRERQRDHSVDLGNLSSRRMSFESQQPQLQTPNTEIMALSVLGNAIAPEQKPRVPTMSERDVTRRHNLCFTRNRAFFS